MNEKLTWSPRLARVLEVVPEEESSGTDKGSLTSVTGDEVYPDPITRLRSSISTSFHSKKVVKIRIPSPMYTAEEMDGIRNMLPMRMHHTFHFAAEDLYCWHCVEELHGRGKKVCCHLIIFPENGNCYPRLTRQSLVDTSQA